mgnify:CR=1 FL=1|jgi:hypothetical protein
MVTFARNLTGVKKLRPPKLATAKRKPASHAGEEVKAVDRGARIPTRELKVMLGVLESFLGSPVHSQSLNAKALRDMTTRMEFLRKELAGRDARDNRPLSAKDLSSKLTQAAPKAAQNGMRVSVKRPSAGKPVDFHRGIQL